MLTRHSSVIGDTTATICANQLPFTWYQNTLTAAGTATTTLVSAAGCDSVVTLTLIVNPNVTGDTTATICANQLPFTWYQNTLTATGTATTTLVSAAGCDSLVTLTLIVNPVLTDTTTVTICANQLPYSWNGVDYTAAGVYVDSLINAAGCDSIATLILTVNPVLTDTTTVTICANQLPYSWNGVDYTAAGVYVDSLTTAAGCDSIATLILNVDPVLTDSTTVTICANQLPYTWNGVSYTAAGVYVDSLVTAAGCDSIATLILNVDPVLTDSTTVTICANQLPYTWNGVSYTAAGVYVDSLVTAAGCDSIATLILNVDPVLTDSTTVTICANQLPYTWNGVSYTAAGVYVDSLVTAAGCDSIATLILNVDPVLTDSTTVTICANQLPYTWNGVSYTAAGVYVDSLVTAAGCDSIATLILNVDPVLTDSTTVTICANQLPYTWNGVSYTAAGVYVDSLVTAAGCDSIATLILNVDPVLTDSTTVTICANQLPYTWNGVSYTAAGVYVDSLVTAAGCDSIATLILNVDPVLTDSTTVTICANQLPYTWNGVSYTAAGVYVDSLVTAAGCDSIATLILNVDPVLTDSTTVTICANQLPYTWNGNNYTAPGVYVDSLVTAAGCDSIATLILNVDPALTDSTTVTICANQLPYTWNGNNYTAAGVYVDSLVTAAGCDSIATLILDVDPVLTDSTTVTICANQLPYTWNGNNYTAAGVYVDSLVTAAGCDSILTLILAVNPVSTSTTSITVCNAQLPYAWNGNNYNTAGTYSVTLQN